MLGRWTGRCALDRFDQRFCRERLSQVGNTPRLERSFMCGMFVVPGDKNDWQRDPRSQPTAQLDAGDTITQVNIEDDAESLVQFFVASKGLCRVEQYGIKTQLRQ